MSTVAIIIGVFVAAVLGFTIYLFINKRKSQRRTKPENPSMAKLQMKVSSMEAQGKVQGSDYKVFIVSESEYYSKTPEEIKAWMSFEPPLITGKGLYEFSHNGIDIFLLIVEKTSQPVIDWNKEPEPILITVGEGDQTEYLKGILENPELNNFKFSQGESDGKILVKGDRYVILGIKNKTDLVLEGKSQEDKTHLYTESAFTERVVDRPIIFADKSFRKAFMFTNTSGIAKNLIYSSNNDTPTDKAGRPDYYSPHEFEAAFDFTGCRDLILENCEARYTWGDSFYIGKTENDTISLINCKGKWAGRLAIGLVGGKNILIDGFIGEVIRRSGFNIEPNFETDVVDNCIFRNGYIECGLTAFPMGRVGRVSNILIENNTYKAGFTTIVKSDGNSWRRNIIFRGNTRLGGYGSPQAAYVFENAENILIENEVNNISFNRSQKIVSLKNCKNVTIRNNDFEGGKFIELIDTDPSEVKVYGNSKELFFLLQSKDKNGNSLPPEIIPANYKVATQGEPDVPKDPVLPQLDK